MDVPAKYTTASGLKLGSWLSSLRRWKNAGAHPKYLTPERIEQLDSIGFAWKLENQWEQSFHRAEAYAQAHGDLNVARDYRCEDGYLLGVWIDKQRNAYKKAA